MDVPPPILQNHPPGNENPLPSLLSLKVGPPEEISEPIAATEVVLPQVLEEVLALKTQRALELGTEIDANIDKPQTDKEPSLAKEDNVVCIFSFKDETFILNI